MMTQLEAAKLITAARQFDRFLPPADDISSALWMERFNLSGIEYPDAYRVIVGSGPGVLTIQSIIDGALAATRRTPAAIAEDVRSARARGLVSRDWAETDPIPDDVRVRLTELRDEARATAVHFKEVAA